MPPYRKPKIETVVLRSVIDRTIFVLGRAKTAAATGRYYSVLVNGKYLYRRYYLAFYVIRSVRPNRENIMGLDGVILTAFILGFPANEIVVPIMIMAYMENGVIVNMSSLFELKALLISNGWTWITAVSMMLFSLMHWPCATTLMTIKKETGSAKWTVISFNNAVGGRFYNMHFVFKYSDVIHIKTGRKFFRPVSYFYFARYSLFF